MRATIEELYNRARENPDSAEAAEAVEYAEECLNRRLEKHGIICMSENDFIRWGKETDAVFSCSGVLISSLWNGETDDEFSISPEDIEELKQYSFTAEEAVCYNILNLCTELKNSGLAEHIIICQESAAELMHMTTVGVAMKVFVYTDLEQNKLPVFVEKVDTDYSGKSTMEYFGMKCTTELQTLLDILDKTDYAGSQVLYESLNTYYEKHDKSFAGLEDILNKHQKEIFGIYKQDAAEYYWEV